MESIIFNDKLLWNWMKEMGDNPSHPSLFSILKKTVVDQIDRSYVVALHKLPKPSTSSELLTTLRRTVPPSYMIQIDYCLATYAKIFGIFFPPLASFVEELAYIEWLLYTEPGYVKYRDHLVHMFKVACVASWFVSQKSIIDKIVSYQFEESAHFENWIAKKKYPHYDKTERKRIILIAIVLASLFHDFGYGYFFLRLYKERLSKLYTWMQDEVKSNEAGSWNAGDFLDSLCAAFLEEKHTWLSGNSKEGNKKRDFIVAGCASDLMGFNHSMASGLFLLNMLDTLKNGQ